MHFVRAALAVSIVAFSAFHSAAHEASSMGVTAAHPWVRATPGGSTTTAAYLEIRLNTDITDRLIGASSLVAGRAEIHTHEHSDGVMKMRRVDSLELKSGGSTVLKPHGNHIMLMDLARPLKEGDLVKLTLEFEKAGKIEVEATVEPVGAMGPHGLDHQPGHHVEHHGEHHGAKKENDGADKPAGHGHH